MIKRILSKSILIILFLWTCLSIYFFVNNLGISNIKNRIILFSEIQPIDIESDYLFITKFLDAYYKINTIPSSKDEAKKIKSLREMIASSLQEKVVKKYRMTLNYFSSQKGTQSFTLQKIIRDKNTGIYRSYLYVYQNIKEKKKYLVQIDLKIKPAHHGKRYGAKITYLDDKGLNIPPNDLLDKNIHITPNTISQVKLPCLIKTVSRFSTPHQRMTSKSKSPTSDSININFSANLQHIKFYSENKIIDQENKSPNNFEAKCKQRIFRIKLSYDENLLTVYQALHLSDGVKKRKKKLSARELFKKKIEEDIGLVITSWE